MNAQAKRICILGGGFGGLYTALRLNELPWEAANKPEIVLIDKSDRFLFSPLLYELVTGELQTWEIAPPFAEILAETDVCFHRAYVTGIDVEGKRVELENSPDLPFDKLVIAMGGQTPLDIVPGAVEYAIPFRSLSDAYRLDERLRELESSERDKIRVAIAGGGYSGVELACKLADRLGDRGRIRLIERAEDILSTSPEFNREAAKKALLAREVWLDTETTIESITPESLALLYKGQLDTIPVDILLWTVGTKVSDFIQALPLKHNQQGRLTVTPTLQAVDYEDIYALGDLADSQDVNGQQVPATAQSALQQSDYCAWNIWASMSGRPLLPLRYQNLGEMMALGTDNATLNGLGLKLDGNLAYLARRLVYLYRMPSWKHQLTVGLNWITQPIVELLSE
ncbi:MAG: NAD(P)/FAD-dependent oxidoreductase [Oscillatoria sp. PMC 1068.18]|nr:NAD(P)/FAD-dependent oxidoreductase [Oscillatoria sp. PMC 1076.18]MEC4988700.1 NAD(P)/FAD-dependent oxidoreductase [Oscillatoria sp. PMC 1068.18]